MPQKLCPYTRAPLPLDPKGRSHMEGTQPLQQTLKSFLSSEQKLRGLIRECNHLASKNITTVLLAAYGLCGLRAIELAPGSIAVHRPSEMSRGVYRQKTRIANKLAERCYQLIHSTPIA